MNYSFKHISVSLCLNSATFILNLPTQSSAVSSGCVLSLQYCREIMISLCLVLIFEWIYGINLQMLYFMNIFFLLYLKLLSSIYLSLAFQSNVVASRRVFLAWVPSYLPLFLVLHSLWSMWLLPWLELLLSWVWWLPSLLPVSLLVCLPFLLLLPFLSPSKIIVCAFFLHFLLTPCTVIYLRWNML